MTLARVTGTGKIVAPGLELRLPDGTLAATLFVRDDGCLDIQSDYLVLLKGKPILTYAPTRPPAGATDSPLVANLALDTVIPSGTISEPIPIELVNIDLTIAGTWSVYSVLTIEDTSASANSVHFLVADEDGMTINTETESLAAGSTLNLLQQGTYTLVDAAHPKHVAMYAGTTGDALALASNTVLICILVP